MTTRDDVTVHKTHFFTGQGQNISYFQQSFPDIFEDATCDVSVVFVDGLSRHRTLLHSAQTQQRRCDRLINMYPLERFLFKYIPS